MEVTKREPFFPKSILKDGNALMKLSKIFWLCKLGVLTFFILLTMGLYWEASWLTGIGVIILVIAAAVFQWKYRCPCCHKLLNSRSILPVKVCPRCGKNLANQ